LVACLNGLGVALAGNLARLNKWRDFLGISDPDLSNPPFGPFIYKNQAGAYLCLACTIALGLTFYLAKRRGDKVDRGGPHLIVGVLVIFLGLGAASTMSFAAVAVAAAIILVVAPAAYLLDSKLRANLSLLPAIAFAALGVVVIYVGMLSTDAKKWRSKIERKERQMEQIGADDRAPLRRATWLMVETTTVNRQLSGFGAGSFRWVSPAYLSTQPEFLNKKGVLARRATHAHNDWLQAPVEWGLAGWAVVAGTLAFLVLRVRTQLARPHAPAFVLVSGLLFFSGHLFLDFLLFIPQLTLLALLVAWLAVLEPGEHSPPR
jgi:O-antigen ligase